jgi:subtilisin family serine protease
MKIKHTLVLAILTARLAASAYAQDLYYLYNGQRIPLTATPGKVAVRSNTSDAAQAQRSLASAAAVNVTDTSPLGIPGWTTVDLAASQSATMRSLATAPASPALAAQTMAAQPGVAFATPVFTVGGSEVIPTGEILVKIADGTDGPAALAALRDARLTGQSHLGGNIFKVTTSLKDGVAVVQLANSLNGKPGIVSAEPNMIQSLNANLVPTDPLFGQAWGLRNTGQYGGLAGFDMGATAAWDATMGSSTVVVVVFECGIDPDHPDIHAIPGKDFTSAPVANAGPRPGGNTDADHHGTWVAGCISGRANNGIGATGVAPGVRVASARIGLPTGSQRFSSDISWRVNALNWAISIGARVTNHSYSSNSPSSVLDAAFLRARNAGIVHFAATGNDNEATVGYPASSPHVVGIGAANRFGRRASFSDYGAGLDFMAPGVDIITTDRVGAAGESGDYATVQGTSFASPCAAGVAALIISRNPTWTSAQVEQRMRDTCNDMGAPGVDTETGHGLLNVARALGVTPAPADDYGNSITTARPVSIPSDTNGMIGVAGDEDFFRFTLASRMELTAETASSTDTYGYLLDAAGATLAFNDDANGRRDFRIVSVLNPGTYYVRIRGRSATTTGTYVFKLVARAEFPEISITGNGLEIPSGSVALSPYPSADGTGFGEYNSTNVFTIRNTGNGVLNLTGRPAVVISDVQVRDSSGVWFNALTSPFRVVTQPATSIAAGGSSTFTVRFSPPSHPGFFMAKVSIASTDADESTYAFHVSGVRTAPASGQPADDHGNSSGTATLVAVPGSARGYLAERDHDFFRFSLASAATVTMATTGTTDTYGRLYDSAGTLLAYDDDGAGNRDFRISRTLSAGTYYIGVSGYSTLTTGAYQLNLSR